MVTLITFIIVLGLLVFVHELGHFIVARKMGVKAEEFGFGFPPRFGGFYKNTEGKWKYVRGNAEVQDAADTVYSLNWIPLGGFVKIKGENGENQDNDSFVAKKIWQRMLILVAGVAMNILLAAVLISFGLMVGLPQSVDGLANNATVKDHKMQIVQVMDGSPAQGAGIKAGDIISSIDGKSFTTYDELQNYVDQQTGYAVHYQLQRGDEMFSKDVTPQLREETGKGGIGIAVAEFGIVSYPWYQAIWEGFRTTFLMTWAILLAFFDLFKGLLAGRGVAADLSGPVGIAVLTGQVARMGFAYLVNFTAMLSINLAIINILPFPALDGGRLLFLVFEKIKGSPVKREVEAVIHNIGFLLLMVLVLFVTVKDVSRFGGLFKGIWERLIG